jgi:uncharacterized protein with PIN domain
MKPMVIKFATEDTLGKLTKWLRILGFDACEISAGARGIDTGLSCDRFQLTRTRERIEQLNQKKGLFIQSNEPLEQIKEVIRALDITEKDIKPFSRCVVCNTPIEPIGKEAIRHIIPDYVWENHDKFQQCCKCHKIYWAGSHIERGMKRIKTLFKSH